MITKHQPVVWSITSISIRITSIHAGNLPTSAKSSTSASHQPRSFHPFHISVRAGPSSSPTPTVNRSIVLIVHFSLIRRPRRPRHGIDPHPTHVIHLVGGESNQPPAPATYGYRCGSAVQRAVALAVALCGVIGFDVGGVECVWLSLRVESVIRFGCDVHRWVGLCRPYESGLWGDTVGAWMKN